MTVRDNAAVHAEILRLYHTGLSDTKIGEAVGWQFSRVCGFLRKQGLPSHHRKNPTHYNGFFAEIDTWAKAWCLGFILADGCVSENGLEIGLHPQNIAALEYIKANINSQSPILIRKNPTSPDPVARFRPNSRDMVRDLARHGVVRRKSLILKWPTTVPETLLHATLLGHFDGDGSVGLYTVEKRTRRNGREYNYLVPRAQVTIACSWSFAQSYQTWLADRGIKSRIRAGNKGTTAQLIADSFVQCKPWLRLLYEGHEFCLKRKHETALKILNYDTDPLVRLLEDQLATSPPVQTPRPDVPTA